MTTLILVLGLCASNVFMTFAWYWHLRGLSGRPWFVAALVSWGIALFEYLIQVPTNRLGHAVFTVPQLKILQEAVTLCIFVPFAVVVMRERITWNYFFAGLCVMGAVYFVFREGSGR